MTKKFDQWQRKPPEPRPQCDLCSNEALWFHPAGGQRCDNCPKPKTDTPTCECSYHVRDQRELSALCGHVKQCPLFHTNF